MGCIYRIWCRVTGQSYIGQTAYADPKYRYRQHLAALRRAEAYPLYEAMREHGIEAFEMERIQQVPNSQLNALECYYAEVYDAYVWAGGYNLGECGKAVVVREMSDKARNWIRVRAIRKNLKH